jgi:MFS transporter, MHS family, shikimate and dehydroshikimate transport protein
MTDSSARAAAPSPSTVRKVALAAMTGSAIEWYDFFIYLTAAALVFGPLFFPGASEVAAVLASFSTAAVGFVARPIGGILFGHFGDKLGRKPTLVIALLTMGTATTLVGVLPTYATIGVAAPIIMVWLLETTGTSLSISVYVFLMAAITFFSVYLITETYEGEMTQDQEQETEEEEAATAG